MTKTKTADIESTIKQIRELETTGCEIVRLAVKDNQDTKALREIKQNTKIPLVADIHFNWRFAIEAIDSGVDKIRLNPGNIYKKEQIREIVRAAKLARIPIRVGLNSGSLPKTARSAINDVATTMSKCALSYIRILEKFGFYDIVISLKASNIIDTIKAYRRMNRCCDYPFHLGVTACGPANFGIIKSSIALGTLLLEGLGDTIRISLTDKPQEEVKVAKFILEAIGLRRFHPEIISCPTCGRCEIDLIKIVKELESKLSAIRYPLSAKSLKVAVMGCLVNGPGEACEADLGVAFGKNEGLLFKRGKPIRKVSSINCSSVLLKELEKINDTKSKGKN
jgi:(E)-4-hydroxy-3-methylbut-2-enyl-diphosphate synthase